MQGCYCSIHLENAFTHCAGAKTLVLKLFFLILYPAPFRANSKNDPARFFRQPGRKQAVPGRISQNKMLVLPFPLREDILNKGLEAGILIHLRQPGIHRRLLQPLAQIPSVFLLPQQGRLPETLFHPSAMDDKKTSNAKGGCLTENPLQHNGSGQGKDQIKPGHRRRWSSQLHPQPGGKWIFFPQGKDLPMPKGTGDNPHPHPVALPYPQHLNQMLRPFAPEKDSIVFLYFCSVKEYDIHHLPLVDKSKALPDIMIIFFYNLLQFLLLPLLSPLIFPIVLLRKKYRERTLLRLGFGLAGRLSTLQAERHRPLFWIHALSTGETVSAIPLIKKIRAAMPDARIVFSTATRSGQQVAEQLPAGIIDSIIYSPLDILPVVHYFINRIKPDCFLLVETDFWPNLLHTLKQKGVPSMLLNGRVSHQALQGYRKMAFLCRPMFSALDTLCLQRQEDKGRLAEFGIEERKLHVLGNLKFAARPTLNATLRDEINSRLPAKRLCLLAGSTHAGEEEIMVQALHTLGDEFPALCLIIAPRDPGRAKSIKRYCEENGRTAQLRSDQDAPPLPRGGILLLDTIGELAACYQLADIAFIGGSLVSERGHNPLEPALFGCPVLFGSSMEDFSEIAAQLLHAKGAFQVKDGAALIATLRPLLQSETVRSRAGEAARATVSRQQDVLDSHLQLIRDLLQKKADR